MYSLEAAPSGWNSQEEEEEDESKPGRTLLLDRFRLRQLLDAQTSLTTYEK